MPTIQHEAAARGVGADGDPLCQPTVEKSPTPTAGNHALEPAALETVFDIQLPPVVVLEAMEADFDTAITVAEMARRRRLMASNMPGRKFLDDEDSDFE